MSSSLVAQRELVDALINNVFSSSSSHSGSNKIAELADRLSEFKASAASDIELKNASKLVREHVPSPNIRLFLNNLRSVLRGETAFIREDTVVPVADLPRQKDVAAATIASSSADAGQLVKKTVFCKLNGGLGTSMGLEKAKSLLDVKNGKTFLDLIAQQTLFLREKFSAAAGSCNSSSSSSSSALRFCLMDSFSTSDDTHAFFTAKYPHQFGGAIFKQEIEFMQSKVPKILQATKEPASCPSAPDNEFCPPGHGEIFTALASSGMLDRLIAEGFEYLFVSNSDNLGATLDLAILSYFAAQRLDFLMEVCERAPVDRKGGHLVRDAATQRLILRESAQCHGDDEAQYTDIAKHRYFNTNNIWINLPALKAAIDKNGGLLPLPVILNSKTVVPTDSSSAKVYQLENAMGAAISYFERSQAIVVERDRFAPVKTCADLLALRSDAFDETPDHRLVLSAERGDKPPVVALEDRHYKFVDQLSELIPAGAPSMRKCTELRVSGLVAFAKDTILEGKVVIRNISNPEKRVTLPSGTLTGEIDV